MADIPPGNVENGEKLFKARCAQCHTALTVKFPAILLGHSVLLERAGGCRTWPRPPTFHCDRAERLLARGRKWVISLARYGRGGGHWVGVG